MSGETETSVSGWTVDPWAAHITAMRRMDEAFLEERDRRYSEVNIEREKALKIKETADLAALSLAREIQDYKDEKANNLRSQIEGERGHYATKTDLVAAIEKLEAIIKPLAEFVSLSRGGQSQALDTRALFFAIVVLLVSAAAIISPHIK